MYVPETATEPETPLELDDMVEWFRPAPGAPNLVGLEVEYGLVRRETGRSITYREPNGCKDLLAKLTEEFSGAPIYEGADLLGFSMPDGSTFTLEMGNAIEYSGAPETSLIRAVDLAKARIAAVAAAAASMNIRVLTGGRLPFEDPEHITWAPKPRTQIMRDHFTSLGHDGALGDSVMGLTLSTQISLDAADEGQYLAKLRALNAASPYIAALLVNTPSLTNHDSGEPSQRMVYWRRIDPARCQDLTARIHAARDLKQLVEELAALPMIYRRSGTTYLPGTPEPFLALLHRGRHEDGSVVTLADWRMLLGQMWPSVRPRRTLETRLPDGQTWHDFALLPALFAGLSEDSVARDDVIDLVGGMSHDRLDAVTMTAARAGFPGLSAEDREITRSLVELADAGLRRHLGPDGQTLAGTWIEPAYRILETRQTPADRLRQRWAADLNRDPQAYVDAFCVPVG